MTRQYFSDRNSPKPLSLKELYRKLVHLCLYFQNLGYFEFAIGNASDGFTAEFQHKAALALNFNPLPIDQWPNTAVTEDNIFDTIEFFYDHIAKPVNWHAILACYCDYDVKAGQEEFRNHTNAFLVKYRSGYELTEDGEILALGTDGVGYILKGDVPLVGDEEIDIKVQEAIRKWRNRHLGLEDRRQAIRDLADVFEWLKKSGRLKTVLVKKDESALFDIANNFSIRHHNPKQRQDYDKNIWYSWMFHFYLATYHAVVRMLLKKQEKVRKDNLSDKTNRYDD